jgi:hypothetical protein
VKQLLCAVAILAALTGQQAAAHHSYAAYEMDRVVEIAGILEHVDVVAPHSLIKLKADDGRLVVMEWLAPNGLQRRGVDALTLKKGDRLVVTGNPHRDFTANGILNFQSVTRPSDGLTWTAARRADSR